MATSMLPIRPVGVRACATTTGNRKPEVSNRNMKGSSSSNWWAPVFGWSTEPDYIDSENDNNKMKKMSVDLSVKNRSDLETDRDSKLAVRARFTEEKAKQLRMMTTESSTFHDVMYHSAIASRLASDFSNGAGR